MLFLIFLATSQSWAQLENYPSSDFQTPTTVPNWESDPYPPEFDEPAYESPRTVVIPPGSKVYIVPNKQCRAGEQPIMQNGVVVDCVCLSCSNRPEQDLPN